MAKTALQRLDPLTALEMLAATGSSQRPLRDVDIGALLQLAGKRDCYLLEYADLREAMHMVDAAVLKGGTSNLGSEP
jgi:hypothetical protein